MADVVAKLQVDSSQFDQKLKSAVEQMTKMEAEVRRTGATFAYADKEELEFIKSLGSLESSSTSARTKMMEYTNAIASLTATYRAMTDEEKKSDFGQGLSASIDQIKAKAAELKDIMSDTNIELKSLASDTGVFDQVAGGITAVTSAFQVGQGAMQAFGVKSGDAMQAMAQLQGVMAVTNGLTKIQAALQKESAMMIGITNMQKKAAAAAEALDTAAKGKNIAVTKAATVAQKALNVVANANPFVLLAAAVIAAAGAFALFRSKADETDQSMKQFRDSVSSTMAGLMTTYTMLQNEWKNLTTEQEKNDWISNNADKFNELGVAIQSVSDAEKVFDSFTDVMVASFERRAKAAALQSLAEEQYKQFYEKLNESGLSEEEFNKQLEDKKNKPLFDVTNAIEAGLYSAYDAKRGQARKNLEESVALRKEDDEALKNAGIKKADDKPVKVEVEPEIPKGILNNLKKQIADAQKELNEAETTEGIEAAQTKLAGLQAEYDKLVGKKKESVKVSKDEVTYASDSIAAQEKKVSDLTKQWKEASGSVRDEYKTQLDEAQAELDRMTGKKVEVEIEFVEPQELEPSLNGPVMTAIEKMQQSIRIKLAEENFEVDQNALTNLMTFAIQKGITGMDGAFEELQYMLSEGLDIKDSDLQAVVDKINEQLANRGLEPIKINFETGGLEEVKTEVISATEAMKESLNSMNSGVSAISTIGNAFNDIKGIGEDLASAFSGEMDAWDSLMTVFNSGIGIMQTVIGVMEAINTLQSLSSDLSKKKVADQAAETTAVVTGKSTEAAANLQEAGTSMTAAGANAAQSSSAAGKSVAGIPIVGPILAVAAIAAVLAATFAAMSKAKSAGKGFASGGIIPGTSFSGDNLRTSDYGINSGELILNRAQQGAIAGQLQGAAQQTIVVTGKLSGRDIRLSANNDNRSRGGDRNFYSKIH